MKWAVALLIAANVAILYWLGDAGPSQVEDVQQGRLPRVSEIRLVDQTVNTSDSRPDDAYIDKATGEPEPTGEADKISRIEGRVAPGPDGRAPGREGVAGAAPEQVMVIDSVEPTGMCFGIGWFDEKGVARTLARRLVAETPALDEFALQERVEELEDFYWVLIPSLESREAALERYRELAARGIEAYVVRSGGNENAISLGLFRSLRSAEQLLSRRQAENIDATLANFPRNRISYALVFGGTPGSLELPDRVRSAESDGELQLIEISDCEGVATAEKNP